MDTYQIKCYFPGDKDLSSNRISDSVEKENLIVDEIKELLSTFRIDVKNYGNANNTIDIISDNCKISRPSWYKNEQGQGITIEGTNIKQKIIVTAINRGNLTLRFMGIDRHYDDKRIPIWIDYKSIKIDGREILSDSIATWHDKPYVYEIPVYDKQNIIIEFELANNHHYPYDYLKENILKLKSESLYIKKNIEIVINKFKDYIYNEKEKFDALPNIEAECFISLGKNCKEAFWLKQFGLRNVSLPFDWMVNYSLSFVLSTLKNGIGIWLNKWKENEKYNGKFRQIQDLNSGMLIQHFFPRNVTAIEYIDIFKQIFSKRIERFREILQNKKSICFLCDRDEVIETRIEFLKALSQMFPLTKFTMINIVHSPESKKIYKKQISSNISLFEVYANNYHEKNSKFVNDGWIGNEDLWNEICSKLSLSDKERDA